MSGEVEERVDKLWKSLGIELALTLALSFAIIQSA